MRLEQAQIKREQQRKLQDELQRKAQLKREQAQQLELAVKQLSTRKSGGNQTMTMKNPPFQAQNGAIKVTLKALVKQTAIQNALNEQAQPSAKLSINSPSGSTKSGISQLSAAAQAMAKSEKQGDEFKTAHVNVGQPILSGVATAPYPLKPQPPQRSSQDQKALDSASKQSKFIESYVGNEILYVGNEANSDSNLVQKGKLQGRSSSIDAVAHKNTRN